MNKIIIEQFKLLLKQIKLDIDNSSGKKQMIQMYRLKSISTALKVIEKYNKEIKTNDDLDKLSDIKGIGKGTIKRIQEILKTGKLSEIKISSLDEKYLKYIEELEEIFGIGRKTAYKLFKEYDIKSIDDLKKKVNKKEIDLPDNILKGLKYIDLIKDNIPRSEIDEVLNYLMYNLMTIDVKLFGTVCGSYRRLKETSGDVDFILVHPNMITKKDTEKHNYLEILIKLLIKNGFIIDSLTGTDVNTKYMGIFKWKNNPIRRIDIRYIPYESYYSAILYFTGSKDFNKKMRQVAISFGYTLNEYGLFNEKGKMFKVESEKDIFDLLGMEYLTPDKRL
jgi:DNA polymerase/3'-5' exonuclease PolX